MSMFKRTPRRTAVTVPLSRRELVLVVSFAMLALFAVIVVAATISYSHMFDWALINGEPRWRAHLSPISVDGALLAASLVMYADARMRNRPDWLAYITALAGIVWSVLANMNHDVVSRVAAKAIAAWPPLALAVTIELVLRFVRRLREASEVQLAKTEKVAAPKPKQPVDVAVLFAPGVQENTKSTPENNTAGLTAEMQAAGWAPDDYDGNLGAAMRGYLEKVNPQATGQDLWSTVGPFFGKSGKDSGMGRTVARKFKEDQAAKTAGE